MDLKAIAEDFDRDGFAIVPEVFPAIDLREIERQMSHYIEQVVPHMNPGEVYYEDSGSRPLKALHRMQQHSEFFSQLGEDPRLMTIMGSVWPDSEVAVEAVMCFFKMGRDGSVTPPHQDNAFQCWVPPLALTATIAIDRSTPDNGPLICLRGSHHVGLLPHRPSGVMGFSQCLIDGVDTDVYSEVEICMAPGDVAIHHINTIHHSGSNRTDRARRQLGISFNSLLAKQDEVALAERRQILARLHEQHKEH